MADQTTAEKIAEYVRIGAAGIAALTPLLVAGVQQYNNVIAAYRALGMTEEEILKHIGAREAKLDPIVAKLASYQVQRHPDDKD